VAGFDVPAIIAAHEFAHQWAVKAEDMAVNDGVNPVGFSAYHWAQKAAASAATAEAIADFNPDTKLDKAGGTVTGDLTRTGPQFGFYKVAIPNGAAKGGGLALVPAANTGGKRSEVSYLDGGGVRVWIDGSGDTAVFTPDGQAWFASTIHAGDAALATNGNVHGTIWVNWGADNLYTAIENRIAEIATNIVNNALEAFKHDPQFTGTLKTTGEIKATGNIGAFTS